MTKRIVDTLKFTEKRCLARNVRILTMFRLGVSSLMARVVGVVSALILFAIPYEYCMRGIGYGFPFAWYHPGHDDWGSYIIHPEEKFSDAIDFVNITASLFFWVVLNGMIAWFINRNGRKNGKQN